MYWFNKIQQSINYKINKVSNGFVKDQKEYKVYNK